MNLYINIYDPEWIGVFSNEKIKNNEKRIFLIGASNVYSIDVDRISEKISSNDVEYGIYNLGNSSPVTLNEFIKLCEKVTNKKALYDQIENQKGDVPKTYADISKARKDLNYNPKISLEEGLKRTYDYLCHTP